MTALLVLNVMLAALAAAFILSPRGSEWLGRVLISHAAALAAYQRHMREARQAYRRVYAEGMAETEPGAMPVRPTICRTLHTGSAPDSLGVQ